jgi:8-oxo-dGTP pyrophosphatase MutT (NUDIX family)
VHRWEQLDPAAMAKAIERALAGGLPGRDAQRTMAPELAYGRHHGPVPPAACQAAVLLAVHRTDSGWSLPAVLRPPTMRAHADQVSLPGGQIEAGETPAQAALREFEEELGCQACDLHVVGPLSPVYVFVSGFEIAPLVAVSSRPLDYRPSANEVAAVVELPLAELADPACRGRHGIERRGLRFTAPHFAIAGQRVWGATSVILAEFTALLQRL